MAASVMMWIACLVIATEVSQVYGQTNCVWGRWGEQCKKACPEHCIVNEARKLQHCHKLTGKCSEGCMRGWHGDMCVLPCSSHCQKNTCNQQNGLCSFGCDGTYRGDFCNITTATPCKETYHCSECDGESGDCLTECDTGYFDQHCKSTCSKNCRNNTCVTSSHGSNHCTEGCVPGYQGINCNIPCDSPGGNCAACPGGCDGGYCQLGFSCVSGCVDSHYGTDCDVGTDVVTVGPYARLSAAAFYFIVMIVLVFILMIVLVIVLVVCCRYRQRLRRNRFQQYVTPVQSAHVSADAIDAREYAVVDEAAMYDALTAGGQPASDGYEELRSVHRSDISRDLAHAHTTEPRTTSM